MLIKTSELEGVALNYAVAASIKADFEIKANYVEINHLVDRPDGSRARVWEAFKPSTDWSQGGPLVEREDYALPFKAHGHRRHLGKYQAYTPGGLPHNGETPLIAACRAIVAANLGDRVEVPDGLTAVRGGGP